MRLPLFFKTSTKCSSKAEGMICPVALWRWRRSRLLHVLNCSAKPKHDVSPLPLSSVLTTELPFEPCLERFGIGSLVLSCSRIHEHGGNGSQFPMHRRGGLGHFVSGHSQESSSTSWR